MKTKCQPITRQRLVFGITLLAAFTTLHAEDWPMRGRDKTRNPVSPEKDAPVEWDIKSGRNIKWRATIGSITMADPAVADGLVWVGSNNDPPAVPGVKEDAPVLKCFRESDGQFVWQLVALPANGFPRGSGLMGFHSSPLIESGRAWLTTRYGRVLCLDVHPLRQGASAPRPVWDLDMIQSLDVSPYYSVMSGGETCSIGASYCDRIYVITGNGVVGWQAGDPNDFFHVAVPNAPSLVCLDQNSGKVLWEDNSPGTNILLGQWGSPLVARIRGRAQVIAPLGDGWVRSFDALTGKLLWKLDINPKSITNRWMRNHFLNAPVLYQDHVFIGGGHDMEAGEGPGSLFCIDPTRRGDVSLELADGQGRGKPNPNSAVVWHFDSFGRTMSQVAIHEGLVLAGGFNGVVHCLDAKTGQSYWHHDMKAHVFASPLIVDGKVYLGDEDGKLCVFALSKKKSLLFTHSFDAAIWASPIFANGVLYIATVEQLFAIQQGASSPSLPNPTKP